MNFTKTKWIGIISLFVIMLISTHANSQSYLYNFDSGTSEGWVSYTQSGSSWELGTPTASGFQPAFSAPSCWGTDLDSGFRGNTIAYLTSPMMQISNLTDPYFSFKQFRYMPFGFDGFYLEYSKNGTTWNRLTAGLYADNWYNTTSVYATTLPGFTGNSSTWQQSGIHLNYLGHLDSIKIRFVFNSYIFGSGQPGVLLDQFSLSQSNIPHNDFAALSFAAPITTGNNVPIKIQVKNNSSIAVDSFIVGYTLNNVTTTFLKVRTLQAYATDTITIGLATIGTASTNVCAFARGRNDYNYSNDTICSNITTTTTAVPYSDNFDNGNNGWTTTSADTLTRWQLGYPNFGLFVGAYSGNSCWDVNLNSNYDINAQAYLISPTFYSATPYTQLKFKMRYELEPNYDGGHLEYSIDNGVTWGSLGGYLDANGINWYNSTNVNSYPAPCWNGTSAVWNNVEYNLSSLNLTGNLKFRFVMHSDNAISYNGISIDDFFLTNASIADLKTTAVTVNTLSVPVGTNSGSIGITVMNAGSTTITSFIIGYTVNGVTTYTTTVTGAVLNPGYVGTYFVPGFTVQQNVNNVCGFCQYFGDAYPSNDTTCINIIGNSPQPLNYYDNFDSGNNLWYADNSQSPGSSWELGYPFFNATTGTYSGNNAWDINLNTGYGPQANAYLYSPFFDLTNSIHPKLSFMQNRNTEANWDGMRVDINNGFVWNTLGSYLDPNATNWYTDPSINSTQQPGWAGPSFGWIQSTYKLDAFANAGTVQFRFAFNSDNSIQVDGISIDDFSLKQASQYDGALIAAANIDTVYAGYSTPLSVYLQNQGINNISNVNIQYLLNNNSAVNQSWSGNLLTDSFTLVNLPNFIPAGGWNVLTLYLSWPNDMDHQNDTITLIFWGIYEHDAALLGFTAPVTNLGQGSPAPVQVVLQNQGGFPLTNLSIKYTNNNGVPLNYNWSGYLPKDSTTLVTLPPFIPVGGTNNLKAYIDWSLDAVQSNDTINLNAFAIVTANLTYSYDFENGDQGWFDSSYTNYTQWELGSPGIFPTNFAHSGINCWDINLNTPYFNVAYASLFSPLFVISNYSKVNIDFWLNYSTEYAADGTYLEYSLDGNSWEVLGSINDPNATNWYNTTMFGNNIGWTGNSNGWKNCSYSFNNLTGANILQLKFVFKSDINLTSAGVSLDDITLQGVVGIEENTESSKYIVFPNPSSTNCRVIFPNTTAQIQLIDANGKSVIQLVTQNETSRNINTDKLAEGFYLLQFIDVNGSSHIQKLQVVH